MAKGRPVKERRASASGKGRPGDPGKAEFRSTLAQLQKVRSRLQKLERGLADPLAAVHPSYRASARNLVHYVAFRRHDMRAAQRVLAAAGLASLGHSESAVLANLNAVIGLLRPLACLPERSNGAFRPPVSVEQAREILRRHTEALLGPKPRRRTARIMVTQPAEAATDYEFVKELVRRGMDCARINCAHDTPDVWVGIARNVRRASKELRTPCRIIMDLGGPKIRTGRIEPGPPVLKWRPVRDRLGRVLTPATICLTASGSAVVERPGVMATLTLPRAFVDGLSVGQDVRFRDARGARRSIRIAARGETYALAEARATAYVTNGTELEAGRRPRKKHAPRVQEATLRGIPREDQPLLLRRGDALVVTRNADVGREARVGADGRISEPARIGCTLPAAVANARRGEAILVRRREDRRGDRVGVRPSPAGADHARPARRRAAARREGHQPARHPHGRVRADAPRLRRPRRGRASRRHRRPFVREERG